MNPSVHSYYGFTQADFKAIRNTLPSGIFFSQAENDTAWHPALYKLNEGTVPAPPKPSSDAKSENATTKCLPLMKVSIDMDVVSTISKATLTQTYLNHSGKSIKEARYLFPLYEGAAVCSFRCTFGDGRVLEGEVKPKETAKAEFEQAKATYITTGLLEEHTSEIFEIHLGNIPAETTLKIEIEYFNELKADTSGEGLLVTIPTAIAPRYGPQPAEFSLKKDFQESGLSITVNVFCNEQVRGLQSLSHPIYVEIGTQNRKMPSFGALAGATVEETYNPKMAKASLIDPTAKLDKDFVLTIIPASATVLSSQAVVEVNDKDPNFAAIMITIYPKQIFPSVSLDENHDEIVFIADCSSSMIDKIETLKQAMFVFLRSLPKQCQLNIYSFGSTFTSLWGNSQVYSQATLEQATQYVRKMQADMGGTEILKPVRSAFENRNKGDSRTQIIILTDGEVFNTRDTIDFVHQVRSESKETVRFFALGIGHQASHELVEGIARNGGGYAEVVAIDGGGMWQERVIQMLKAALMPSSWTLIADSALGSSMEGEQSNSVNGVIQAPREAPSVHPFSRRSIYLLYDLRNAELPEKIEVTGSMPDGRSVKATLDVEKTNLDLSLITLLAVKQRIKDLEESSEPGARDEAERLGMQWKVTGKYTSFIIVDRSDGSRKELRSYRPKRSELASLLGAETARFSGKFPLLRTPLPPCYYPGSAPRKPRISSSRLESMSYASVWSSQETTPTAPTIQHLLALQSFDGSFPELSDLFPFLAHFYTPETPNRLIVNVYSIHPLFKAVPSTKVHSTILAVHMMPTIFYAHKSLWELCRQKAITWLREQVKSCAILYSASDEEAKYVSKATYLSKSKVRKCLQQERLLRLGQFDDSESTQRYHDFRSYERWMKPGSPFSEWIDRPIFEQNMREIEVYCNDLPQSRLLDGERLDDDDDEDIDMEDVAHAASQGKAEQAQNTATQ